MLPTYAANTLLLMKEPAAQWAARRHENIANPHKPLKKQWHDATIF
jgi:hypothetical protein